VFSRISLNGLEISTRKFCGTQFGNRSYLQQRVATSSVCRNATLLLQGVHCCCDCGRTHKDQSLLFRWRPPLQVSLSPWVRYYHWLCYFRQVLITASILYGAVVWHNYVHCTVFVWPPLHFECLWNWSAPPAEYGLVSWLKRATYRQVL
jgi:hypothetical protein